MQIKKLNQYQLIKLLHIPIKSGEVQLNPNKLFYKIKNKYHQIINIHSTSTQYTNTEVELILQTPSFKTFSHIPNNQLQQINKFKILISKPINKKQHKQIKKLK